MLIIKGVLLILWFVFIPMLIGSLIDKISKLNKSFIMKYIVGVLFMFALFQIIAVPLILTKQRFSFLVEIYIIGISLVSIIAFIYLLKEMLRFNIKNFKVKFNIFSPTNIVLLVFFILVVIQCYFYVGYQHVDADDSRYIVNATEAYQHNNMLLNDPVTGDVDSSFTGEISKDVISPWMIYVALISKVVMIHPTIIAHTIIPVFLVILIYLVYYLIAKKIFNKDLVSVFSMLCFISLLNIFGNYSVYTSETFMLTRIWQGKAVFAALIIPLLIYCLLNIYTAKKNDGNYIVLFLSMISSCLMSGLGTFLTVIIVMVFGLWYGIIKRSLKNIFVFMVMCFPNVIYCFIYYLLK